MVGEASDGEEALEKVPELKPDVLLLDIRMPRLNGIAVLEALREAGALPPTLVLTTFDDGDAAIAAIKAGAKGLMLKDVSLEDLAQAIRALADDKTAFQPAMTESLMAAIRAQPVGFIRQLRRRGADRPGTRGAAPDLRRLQQQGNRRLAGAGRGDGEEPRVQPALKLDARDRTRAALKALAAGAPPLGAGIRNDLSSARVGKPMAGPSSTFRWNGRRWRPRDLLLRTIGR